MPKPLCFMIMPYDRKPTQVEAGHGVAEIDFNALWDRVYFPIIRDLGYEPVRADQDSGALIINEMLERLYFADLVLADMTIPNGNVYYEVGIRHAAKEKGCVLLAADWSRQLFDVMQMRTVRYPLTEGDITEATAQAIGTTIKDGIVKLAQGSSPMHASIKGFPLKVDEAAASTMKDRMAELAQFQGEIRAVRAAPRIERMQRAKALIARNADWRTTATMALALLRLLRDCADSVDDWKSVLEFIDQIPAGLGGDEEVREQRALALSNVGKHIEALAELEALVEACGATPERLGLIGGRYKRLLKTASTPAEAMRCLAKAIEHYERGMELDLNEYYCSCNLPRLYRQRRRAGDEERAQSVLRIVIAACERAKKRGIADEWLRPTLLSAAFDSGDADKAEELAQEVAAEGASQWKLDSILADLESSVARVEDVARRDRLAAIMTTLRV